MISGTWLAQVGVLTCTVACGAARRTSSAPRRKAPAAARALDRPDALSAEHRVTSTKNQLFHGLVECGIACRSHVGLARLALQHGLFGLAHAVQNRCVALGVAEHPYAQIDLFRVRIGAKCSHEAQNRVVGNAVETLKTWLRF